MTLVLFLDLLRSFCVSLISLDVYTATVDVKKVSVCGYVGLRARDSREAWLDSII